MTNNKLRGILLAGIGGAMAIAMPASAQKTVHFDGRAQAAQDRSVKNQYICVFKPGAVARGNARVEGKAAASRGGGRLIHSYDNAISGFALSIPEHALARMQAANPKIAYCEADQIVKLAPPEGRGPKNKDPVEDPDPGTGSGGYDDGDAETPWGIDRVGGGSYSGTGRAFVLDTGVDLDHIELDVDTALSTSFVSTEAQNGGDDIDGHGTHVAGTIAALRNGIGVAGVAAGAKVISVRVLDANGSGSYADIIAGVDYVAANGRSGDVANMSLGGGYSLALNTAVVNASRNVKFALAAGNDGRDTSSYSPASAEGPNIVTIAAIDETGGWARFSNYGAEVDWAEPGVDILSTYPNDYLATMSGTSMAAPHAAGLLLRGPISADGTVRRRRGDEYAIGVN